MPPEIKDILKSYYSCESRKASYRWQIDVADALIQEVKILSREDGVHSWETRAYCPLCGEGSTGSPGFAVPEGLQRHFVGLGNIYRCNVFAAAEKLAREYWDRKFSAAEKAEQEEQLKHEAQRRLTETLYQVEPKGAPMLIDSIWMKEQARNSEEMIWAENRLIELGFQINLDGNIKSYTDDREELLVYADPRCNGEINFSAYKKPLSKRSRLGLATKRYKIRDSWKHELKNKYEAWLAKASHR